MLNDYGNENGKKRSIGLISKKKKKKKKKTLHMQRPCLEISFPCCWNVKLAGNTFSEKMSYVLLKNVDACVPIRLFFFTAALFQLADR